MHHCTCQLSAECKLILTLWVQHLHGLYLHCVCEAHSDSYLSTKVGAKVPGLAGILGCVRQIVCTCIMGSRRKIMASIRLVGCAVHRYSLSASRSSVSGQCQLHIKLHGI